MEKLTIGVVLGAALGSGFRSVFGAARTELSTLGQEIQKTTKLQNQIGKMVGLEAGAEKARQRLQEARIETERLRLQFALASSAGDKAAGAAERAWEKAKQKTLDLEVALEKERLKVTKVGEALRKAGVDTKDLSAENERLGQSLDKQTAAFMRRKAVMEERGSARDAMKGEIIKIGASIAYLTSATNKAIGFESAMADVRKVVDFESPEQFRAMGSDIQKLASRLPMTAEGIAAIVAAGGQAGFARKELLGFAEDATKMGIAFDTTADEAGQMMAQWRTAFKMGQGDVRGLADQINYLGNTGPANAKKISEIVTRIGPLGEVSGVASGQIAALGATVAGMGIGPEIAATGIKNMMLALNAGSSATKSQLKAFDALGLSAEDMAKRMQVDASGAITEVLQKIRELPKEEQAAALDNLFGKESIAAIAPLLTNMEKLQENLRKVGDQTKYAGSMEKEYASRAATTANNKQLLINGYNRISTTIGNVFLPVMNMAMGAIGGTLGLVADLADKFPFLTNVVVAGATAWIGYRTAVAASRFAMTFMPGTVAKLTTMFPMMAGATTMGTAAMASFSAVLAATPIGWIVAGVGALIGAGILLYKYWEPVKAFFGGFFQGMAEGFAPLGAALAPVMPVLNAIGSAIGNIVGWFGALLSPVQATSAELANATAMGQNFGKVVAGAVMFLISPLTKAWELAGRIGSALGLGNSKSPTTASAGAQGTVRRTAAAAVVATAAATTPAAAKTVQVTQTNSHQISVTAAPGQNPQDVAKAVSQELDRRDREKAAKKRGGLYDSKD